MKLLRIVVEGLPLFQEKLDICFYAQQRVSEDQRDFLYPLFSTVFLNTTNVFAGINASGKTSTLKVIIFVLNLLSGSPINGISVRSILGQANNVTFRIYSYSEKTEEICKLETTISFTNRDSKGQPVYKILFEKLWSKKVLSQTTRSNLLDFDDGKLIWDRNAPDNVDLLSFLPDDSSIIIAKNKKDDDAPDFTELLSLTDSNGLLALDLIPHLVEILPKEVITYLDPSIEYLKLEQDKQNSIHLKFRGKDELVLIEPTHLIKYLSSGTLKGIWVFAFALKTFWKGGYLIVDELENHFNKEIICTIIRFFKNHKFNKNGGTLIYSTHYPELLDENDRNDNIYITNNYDGITVTNLSSILKRNDMKKSDVYQSGTQTGTAPSYKSYIALKKSYESMIHAYNDHRKKDSDEK